MTKKELINNYINILINKGIDKDFMIFDNNELACTLGLVNNNFVLVLLLVFVYYLMTVVMT